MFSKLVTKLVALVALACLMPFYLGISCENGAAENIECLSGQAKNYYETRTCIRNLNEFMDSPDVYLAVPPLTQILINADGSQDPITRSFAAGMLSRVYVRLQHNISVAGENAADEREKLLPYLNQAGSLPGKKHISRTRPSTLMTLRVPGLTWVQRIVLIRQFPEGGDQ